MGLAFQAASASLAHNGFWAVGSPSLLPPPLGWVDCAFAPNSPAPNSSMEEEGTSLGEKPLPGWDASNFYNIPHLQYIGFLQNDVWIEFLKVDLF